MQYSCKISKIIQQSVALIYNATHNGIKVTYTNPSIRDSTILIRDF